MTFAQRVKALRRELSLSQEALGAQGFVSTPGWVKVENGQRHASEKMIRNLTEWLVKDKYMRAGEAAALKEELLTLKYLSSPSAFVREMAKVHAKRMPDGGVSLFAPTPDNHKAKLGRPKGAKTSRDLALVAEKPGVYRTKRSGGK
jgi:transcriptional regulator with XRE-family HTH domain